MSTPTAALPYHPLADLFPLLEGREFDELVADIKANGLHECIVLLDEQILDGRNRYRACIAAGVEPLFVPYRGDDPAAFVVSMNVARRHLAFANWRNLTSKGRPATERRQAQCRARG
jgi:ParB-like chromosome segregation protein Spo0J